MAKDKVVRCKCSRNCTAEVLTKGRLYARGHNPATWNRSRLSEEARKMTAEEFAAYRVKLRNQFGPYATEKRLGRCPKCGHVDGVRGLMRHRKVCAGKKVSA